MNRERSSRGEVISARVSYSGAVRRRVPQEVRQLAGQHGENLGELQLHRLQRWLEGTRGLVFGALSSSETRGLSPWHRVQLLAVIPDGSMMVPVFWGEYSKGVPLLLMLERKKGN